MTRKQRWTRAAAATLTLSLAAGASAQVAPEPEESLFPIPDEVFEGDGTAAPEGEAVDAVRLLLSAHHQLPSRDELEAATPDAESVLWQIATYEDELLLTRQRALSVLRAWPSDRLRGYYERLLADEGTHEMVQHQVLGHLLDAFGERGLATAEIWLNHPDLQHRLTAIHGLARLVSERATELLEGRLAVETDPFVRERLEGALRLR